MAGSKTNTLSSTRAKTTKTINDVLGKKVPEISETGLKLLMENMNRDEKIEISREYLKIMKSDPNKFKYLGGHIRAQLYIIQQIVEQVLIEKKNDEDEILKLKEQISDDKCSKIKECEFSISIKEKEAEMEKVIGLSNEKDYEIKKLREIISINKKREDGDKKTS